MNLLELPEAIATSARRAELLAQYPHLGDARMAIDFALISVGRDPYDFLESWRDGAWDEIEQAYPEFLERCR